MTTETRGNDGAGLHEIMTEALTRIGFDTRSLGILCGLRKRSQQLLWLPWGDLGKPRSHASEKKRKRNRNKPAFYVHRYVSSHSRRIAK